MRRIIYVALAAGFLVLVGLVYGIAFGVQTYSYFLAKSMTREQPVLNEKPIPLDLREVAEEGVEGHTYFGWSFETAWGKPKDIQTFENLVVLRFMGGELVTFTGPASALRLKEAMLAEARKRGAVGQMEEIFGKETFESNYDLTRRVLYTTAKEQKIFVSRQKAVSAFVLFNLKTISVTSRATRIFEFETARVRGFQAGDPEKGEPAIVYVFDAADNPLDFIIVHREDMVGGVRQMDINRLLTSLREAEPAARVKLSK